MHVKTGYLSGAGGLKLHYQVRRPDSPVGSLVLVHGLAEHSGRYRHVIEFLNQLGLVVYALDQRGHGQSEGDRVFVDRFEQYQEDLRKLVELATAEHGRPIMLGHSMGGLISFNYALIYPDTLRALILSSPWLGTKAKINPVLKAVSSLLAVLTPRLQIKGGLPPSDLCRDPAVVEAYTNDPLVPKFVTPRLFIECGRAQQKAAEHAAELKIPVLFLQAGEDRLADAEATRWVYQHVAQDRKAFKLYPGMYHEILNDPDHQTVLQDIRNWLCQQELVPTV